MVSSRKEAEIYYQVSEDEFKLLSSPAAPIVLLYNNKDIKIAESVTPGNPFLSIMLPFTPLHYLILQDLKIPIIATSGNRRDEPICTDEYIALECLSGIADLFLVHNRPINHGAEGSVVRIIAGRDMVLRRGRGNVVTLSGDLGRHGIAVMGSREDSRLRVILKAIVYPCRLAYRIFWRRA